MSSTKQRLRLIGAFAALAALALAASCRGFFVPEQLGSITISPSTANVPLGGTTQLQAFGTNTDSTSAGNITGKVSWSSSSGAVGVSSSGVLSGNTLSSAAATITAEYQGISATSTANVCVENGTNFTITFSPTTATIGQAESAYAYADVSGITGQVDISSGVTWSSSNPSVTITAGDPAEIDTTSLTSATTVTIFATYSCNGVNNNFQSNLTVSQ
ncbi:MAG TPA: hypothetical protein VMG31_03760 [Verrucomicrobiae bacterium]|nr:hypothetical protein [Verrucomicrobiae bacterium]